MKESEGALAGIIMAVMTGATSLVILIVVIVCFVKRPSEWKALPKGGGGGKNVGIAAAVIGGTTLLADLIVFIVYGILQYETILTGGAIAGIIMGAIGGLALIVSLIVVTVNFVQDKKEKKTQAKIAIISAVIACIIYIVGISILCCYSTC